MTAKTAGDPGRMTGDTGHIAIAMGQLALVFRNVAPGRVVFAQRFGVTRLWAVVTSAGGDSVNSLRHSPPASRNDHRVLNNVAGFKLKWFSVFSFPFLVARQALKQRDLCTCFVAHANARQVLTHQRLIL